MACAEIHVIGIRIIYNPDSPSQMIDMINIKININNKYSEWKASIFPRGLRRSGRNGKCIYFHETPLLLFKPVYLINL